MLKLQQRSGRFGCQTEANDLLIEAIAFWPECFTRREVIAC